MAGNYDDILRYWEKLFSGDELGEELSKEKYKLDSGMFQGEILDKIEADMYSTWLRSHSEIPYDEYRRGKMTGYLEVVDKFLGEGVTSMRLGNFDLNNIVILVEIFNLRMIMNLCLNKDMNGFLQLVSGG